MKAMPTVATVVHELPVISDTKAQTRQARKRNSDGVMTFMP